MGPLPHDQPDLLSLITNFPDKPGDTTMIKLGPLQIAIILLTVATALIHIVIAIPDNLWMFYLNGIGYLALVTALYLPRFERQRGLIRWALIAYTAATIIAWVAVGERNTIGYADKAIEVVLIVLLIIDGRRSS